MDSQILVLRVKFSRIKPHLVVATNMNNTSEKMTTPQHVPFRTMFPSLLFLMFFQSMVNTNPIELLNLDSQRD